MTDPTHIVDRFIDRRSRQVPLEGQLQSYLSELEELESARAITRKLTDDLDLLGVGGEGAVYELGDEYAIKVSRYPREIRAQYLLLGDPTYEDITPTLHDHSERWFWFVMERVDAFSAWSQLHEFFPGIVEAVDAFELSDTGSLHRGGFPFVFTEILRARCTEDFETDIRYTELDSFALETETLRSIWSDYLSSDERAWFDKVAGMHQDLGLSCKRVGDIRPANMGRDDSGNLVVFDVWTTEASFD